MIRDHKIREELAFAYQVFAHLGWDDSTYTHLSARIPGKESFLIQPFGFLFEEVTPENLIEVDFEGKVLDNRNEKYNHTGYVIHANIYQSRSDLNAIFHLHTIDGVSVSAMKEGLLPLSQFSLHFYNRMSYHEYASLALDFHHHGSSVVNDLGPTNKAMILRNHGTVTCGETIHEAFLYAYFLEKSCQVQTRCIRMGNYVLPSPEICEQSARDLREFEPDFGRRDWEAWKRKLKFRSHSNELKKIR